MREKMDFFSFRGVFAAWDMLTAFQNLLTNGASLDGLQRVKMVHNGFVLMPWHDFLRNCAKSLVYMTPIELL